MNTIDPIGTLTRDIRNLEDEASEIQSKIERLEDELDETHSEIEKKKALLELTRNGHPDEYAEAINQLRNDRYLSGAETEVLDSIEAEPENILDKETLRRFRQICILHNVRIP